MALNQRERLAAELKRAMAFLREPPVRRVVVTSSASLAEDRASPDADRVKETPISFTPALLDAVLAGRKTQTRRPIRPAPLTVENGTAIASSGEAIEPLCAVGGRLWVREKWARLGEKPDATFVYERGGALKTRWIASRYMPRAAARTFLVVRRVTATRLKTIETADAVAEGVLHSVDPVAGFIELWDSIYGETEFAAQNDPWVWAIEFALAK